MDLGAAIASAEVPAAENQDPNKTADAFDHQEATEFENSASQSQSMISLSSSAGGANRLRKSQIALKSSGHRETTAATRSSCSSNHFLIRKPKTPAATNVCDSGASRRTSRSKLHGRVDDATMKQMLAEQRRAMRDFSSFYRLRTAHD